MGQNRGRVRAAGKALPGMIDKQIGIHTIRPLYDDGGAIAR